MNQTSQFSDQVAKELVRQHDNLLSWTMLSRKERRRQGVRLPKRELERMLLATGLVISQSGPGVAGGLLRPNEAQEAALPATTGTQGS